MSEDIQYHYINTTDEEAQQQPLVLTTTTVNTTTIASTSPHEKDQPLEDRFVIIQTGSSNNKGIAHQAVPHRNVPTTTVTDSQEAISILLPSLLVADLESLFQLPAAQTIQVLFNHYWNQHVIGINDEATGAQRLRSLSRGGGGLLSPKSKMKDSQAKMNVFRSDYQNEDFLGWNSNIKNSDQAERRKRRRHKNDEEEGNVKPRSGVRPSTAWEISPPRQKVNKSPQSFSPDMLVEEIGSTPGRYSSKKQSKRSPSPLVHVVQSGQGSTAKKFHHHHSTRNYNSSTSEGEILQGYRGDNSQQEAERVTMNFPHYRRADPQQGATKVVVSASKWISPFRKESAKTHVVTSPPPQQSRKRLRRDQQRSSASPIKHMNEWSPKNGAPTPRRRGTHPHQHAADVLSYFSFYVSQPNHPHTFKLTKINIQGRKMEFLFHLPVVVERLVVTTPGHEKGPSNFNLFVALAGGMESQLVFAGDGLLRNEEGDQVLVLAGPVRTKSIVSMQLEFNGRTAKEFSVDDVAVYGHYDEATFQASVNRFRV